MKTQRPPRRTRIFVWLVIGLIVVGAIGFGAYRYSRPLPALAVTLTPPKTAPQTVALPWTNSGESAISTSANKVLGQGPAANTVTPTASLAKLITILTVLQKYPLVAGQSGPTITLSQADVDRYNYYNAIDGSTVAVKAGEQLSEYQMFQAMLLPSANNIADSLATWAFGSLSAYRAAAQDEVNHLGMGHTLIGSDASGFLPDTTSTANDLVLLGEAAMKQSVIAEIAGQTTAVLPVVGTIYNTNPDLGQEGVTGLKTGTSDQAGYCFIFTATHTFDDNQTVSFVGDILHAPDTQSRYAQALTLLQATYANYKDVVVAKAGQPLGTITSAWGQRTDITSASDLREFIWAGDATSATTTLNLGSKTELSAAQTVGSIAAGTKTVSLVTSGTIKPPSLWWRIFRP